MPPNPERRNQILDAAIDILCDDGVGGLTHRQVDSRAAVPAGTTSNYFRTRQALLEATAQRTVDLHWQRVEMLQSAIGPLSRDALKALMIRMLEPDEQFRRWTLARFELFMESTRREELRPLGGRLEQRLPGAEVIRRGARRHACAAIDLPMRQTPDAVVTENVDRGVEDLVPTFRVGGHQFL